MERAPPDSEAQQEQMTSLTVITIDQSAPLGGPGSATTDGKFEVPKSAHFTVCCPCKCCFWSAYICCLSTKDVLTVLCCKPCFLPYIKPSWNRSYELAFRIVSRTARVCMHEPNYRVVRLIADRDIPRWLPIMPGGITSQLGDHLEPNTSLPAYEMIYHKKDGSPGLMTKAGGTVDQQRRYVLYFHGGGFVFGSRGSHRQLLFKMCKELGPGYAILSIEYRRSPEFPYPIPGQDCFAAYKWLLQKIGDPSRIVVGGDSAGGALAAEVLLQIRDAGMPSPRGAVLLSPWIDLYDTDAKSLQENSCFDILPLRGLPYFADLYHSPANDSVSVVYKDLRSLGCKLLVEYGESEVFRDSIARFVNKLRDSGNTVSATCHTDMGHVHAMLNLTGVRAVSEHFLNIRQFVHGLYDSATTTSSSVAEQSTVVDIERVKLNV